MLLGCRDPDKSANYSSREPVRIDVFSDRIELWNPGGGRRGLDEASLASGKVQPEWRNHALVSFMLRLGLAQNLGQGLVTILEESERVTDKRPILRNDGDWFAVILPGFRPLVSMSRAPGQRLVETAGQAGIILISIGAPSIRAVAEHSFADLSLSPENVLIDFATAYIEPHSPQWHEQAQRIRDEIAGWVEDPGYSELHLFYRGPVVMAPLIGALVAPVKPLVLYHFEDGRYFPAYRLDRRLLHGASRSPGTA